MAFSRFLLAAVVITTLGACATRDIKPAIDNNSPPAEKFAAFNKFELKPLLVAPAYAENGANQKAAKKIEENLRAKLNPTLVSWNKTAATRSRLLRIEPRIEQIKFIGGAARFWAGAMAGSSAVVMKVRYVDAGTGKVIAEPEFFQKANAFSGAHTMGAVDNMMLSNIANRVTEYTIRNYTSAVGGPTGF